MPAITVIVDGGWCKRAHKHSYNAKCGVGIIMRLASCYIWVFAISTVVTVLHQVFYRSSSTEMETDIILDGFLEAELAVCISSTCQTCCPCIPLVFKRKSEKRGLGSQNFFYVLLESLKLVCFPTNVFQQDFSNSICNSLGTVRAPFTCEKYKKRQVRQGFSTFIVRSGSR